MKKSVKILGTKYILRRVNFGEDEFMERMKFGGYCDCVAKEIVTLNLKTLPDFANDPEEVIARKENETLRHEILHAFFNESGLQWNSLPVEQAWAKNEEMVDWFAIQFPKILKVYKELGCGGE
jgi:hypothetical protein